jgi:hypothetical protein
MLSCCWMGCSVSAYLAHLVSTFDFCHNCLGYFRSSMELNGISEGAWAFVVLYFNE